MNELKPAAARAAIRLDKRGTLRTHSPKQWTAHSRSAQNLSMGNSPQGDAT